MSEEKEQDFFKIPKPIRVIFYIIVCIGVSMLVDLIHHFVYSMKFVLVSSAIFIFLYMIDGFFQKEQNRHGGINVGKK